MDVIGYKGTWSSFYLFILANVECRICVASWARKQSFDHNCPSSASTTLSPLRYSPLYHRRSLESPLADMQHILHTCIFCETSQMATSPGMSSIAMPAAIVLIHIEPPRDPHAAHRQTRFHTTTHENDNRLAQLRMVNSCRYPWNRPFLRQTIQTLRADSRPPLTYPILHRNRSHGHPAQKQTIQHKITNLHSPRPPCRNLPTNR